MNPLLAAIFAMNEEAQAKFEKGQEVARMFIELTARDGKEIRVFADEFAAAFGVNRE